METIPCLSEEDVGTTCDRYCSHVIGGYPDLLSEFYQSL